MSKGRSILFVFAHPDDEAHWGSGVAIRCHDEGARTVLVTLTRGERGTNGGICSNEELPGVREQELREAARILKFDALEILPYVDKEVPNIAPDEIRRVLVERIRRERPDVLITFDPHGITYHLDHIALSRFVTEAIPAAADRRWYPELGERIRGAAPALDAAGDAVGQGAVSAAARRRFPHRYGRVVARAPTGARSAPHAGGNAPQAVFLAAQLRADAELRRPPPGIRPAAAAPAVGRHL